MQTTERLTADVFPFCYLRTPPAFPTTAATSDDDSLDELPAPDISSSPVHHHQLLERRTPTSGFWAPNQPTLLVVIGVAHPSRSLPTPFPHI